MLPLQHAIRWHAVSILLLLLVLVAALMPAVWFWTDRHSYVRWIVNADKWLHGATFVILALWFAGQYRPGWYWRIALGLTLFGVFIEACQRLVTYRSADVLDIVADAAGIGIGLAVALAGTGGWSLRFEHWLALRQASDDVG